MQKINVSGFDYPTQVSVIIDGICNHADTDLETEEFMSAATGSSFHYEDKIEVCRKCKAWRYASFGNEEYPWNGVQEFPEVR